MEFSPTPPVNPTTKKPSKKRTSSIPRTKKETIQKRETRSRHEKKRREEMNEVLSEMIGLLPQDIQTFKQKRVDQKPKQPDKCFIIGNAVEMIKNSDYKPSLLTDPLVRDIFSLTNSFLVFLDNFIVTEIEGDHRSIFDIEKNRMIGKDIRCFLDFESASKLSFLNQNQLINQLQLRSFMAKSMNCIVKRCQQTPSDAILVCVPDELPQITVPPISIQAPPTILREAPPPPKSPPPSKMEVERPILAALLRRKDPPRELEITPKPSETTSTCSFLSPSSSSCSTIPHAPLNKPTVIVPQRRTTTVPQTTQKRKRLRSMNVIVESFPLDDDDQKEEKQTTKRARKGQNPSTSTPMSSMSTPTVPQPSTSLPQTVPTGNRIGMNPFDVLAPGYRDIWLRLQSERLLLEERISAKEGELKNLMQFVQPSQFLNNFPQYLLPQGTLSSQNQ